MVSTRTKVNEPDYPVQAPTSHSLCLSCIRASPRLQAGFQMAPWPLVCAARKLKWRVVSLSSEGLSMSE